MKASTKQGRLNYSALFTLLDCLDLNEHRDPKLVQAIVALVRAIAGSDNRLSMSRVNCIKVYGGYRCSGECDDAGWKRLVIKTGKHQVEILPL